MEKPAACLPESADAVVKDWRWGFQVSRLKGLVGTRNSNIQPSSPLKVPWAVQKTNGRGLGRCYKQMEGKLGGATSNVPGGAMR